MSKLYFIGESDARKTRLTSRGHKVMRGQFLFNWRGGQQAEGGIEVQVSHQGNYVMMDVSIIPSGKRIKDITFHSDGTVEY